MLVAQQTKKKPPDKKPAYKLNSLQVAATPV
jgi:hypothetical protein